MLAILHVPNSTLANWPCHTASYRPWGAYAGVLLLFIFSYSYSYMDDAATGKISIGEVGSSLTLT